MAGSPAEGEPSGSGSGTDTTTTASSSPYSRAFLATRLITFAGIVLGYSCFYLTR